VPPKSGFIIIIIPIPIPFKGHPLKPHPNTQSHLPVLPRTHGEKKTLWMTEKQDVQPKSKSKKGKKK
jgi:hypothetical protein